MGGRGKGLRLKAEGGGRGTQCRGYIQRENRGDDGVEFMRGAREPMGKAKRVVEFRARSTSNGSDVLPLLSAIAEDGWCVVLKKMPPDVGYVKQVTGEREFAGYWYCEATYVRTDRSVGSPIPTVADDPCLLVTEIAERCKAKKLEEVATCTT
jgi:hypothetical protein